MWPLDFQIGLGLTCSHPMSSPPSGFCGQPLKDWLPSRPLLLMLLVVSTCPWRREIQPAGTVVKVQIRAAVVGGARANRFIRTSKKGSVPLSMNVSGCRQARAQGEEGIHHHYWDEGGSDADCDGSPRNWHRMRWEEDLSEQAHGMRSTSGSQRWRAGVSSSGEK